MHSMTEGHVEKGGEALANKGRSVQHFLASSSPISTSSRDRGTCRTEDGSKTAGKLTSKEKLAADGLLSLAQCSHFLPSSGYAGAAQACCAVGSPPSLLNIRLTFFTYNDPNPRPAQDEHPWTMSVFIV